MVSRKFRALLWLFAVVWTGMTVWLVGHFVAGIRTWQLLQETVTVEATIDGYEYQERGSGDTRSTVMVVDYSFERNGQREQHQTDNIAPLAVDKEYFSAFETAFKNQSSVVLHISAADPNVHAFTTDVSYFHWAMATVFPLEFGLGAFVIWRTLWRDWRQPATTNPQRSGGS
ncbi:MAG: hypothetical protein NXI04_21180 [Planctomycetaceae bacterium]|nr:hypothetical protein [Planctomycetaceae bacterium]